MTQTPSIQSTIPTPLRGQQQSFQTARQAQTRAAVTQTQESPETRGALNRLDRVMASGQPLRTDVPRGYYLNIRV